MAREYWRTRLGFIMAAAGFSIGLGNIWRFPYLCGMNGGGAFLLVYVICCCLICVPLLIAEISLGRRTRLTSIMGMRQLNGKWSLWNLISWLGVASALLIMSYYFVVLGWVIEYFLKALSGDLTRVSAEGVEITFAEHVSNSGLVVLHTGVITLILGLVVVLGLNRGVERTCKVLLPGLFLFLVLLAVRSISFPGAIEGLRWYLTPDLSALDGSVVLTALGQAFYSIGVGMAVAFAYGSYLDPSRSDIPGSSLFVVILDILAAFLAGLVIFPALFAFGLSPDSGSGLLFVTMSSLFAETPGGNILGAAFYFLILLAGLTSGIGLLEAVVASVMDLRRSSRRKAVFVTLAMVFFISIPSALSKGPWSEVRVWGRDCFQLVDFLSGNVFLPAGALLLSLYVAAVWKFANFQSYANIGASRFRIRGSWELLVKVGLPAALTLVFLSALGVI
jgi:NSS family neurotransmitter:Na+ symporter